MFGNVIKNQQNLIDIYAKTDNRFKVAYDKSIYKINDGNYFVELNLSNILNNQDLTFVDALNKIIVIDKNKHELLSTKSKNKSTFTNIFKSNNIELPKQKQMK
jgi:hypothetical protein